ncbi:MAG: FtsX-like permease family protein [Streptococcaceae bacterium]|jgi:putative ABC transport system permease protein|nr:FtsX-like permease family protein [Streptococcaceae bacterium]
MFYSKLAFENLKRNHLIYLPFLLSVIFLFSLNLLMSGIYVNIGNQIIQRTEAVKFLFSYGKNIIFIFSIIFTFYANSFVMKHRQKELGIYNILGMDKNALSKMLIIENYITFLITILGGIIGGSIFSKLLFLVLKKLMTVNKGEFAFKLKFDVYFPVIVFFMITFILLSIFNLFQMSRNNPIKFLHASQTGEKEPKARFILATLGFLALSMGYFISMNSQKIIFDPKTVSDYKTFCFFAAIILVIIGTYLAFITGSIALLKLLKKNKKYYYRSKNFITVSNLSFRMKKNGVGLANICILSTMMLVTLITSIGCYSKVKDLIKKISTYDLSIIQAEAVEGKESLEIDLEKIAQKSKLKITNSAYLMHGLTSYCKKITNHSFAAFSEKERNDSYNYSYTEFEFMNPFDYEKMMKYPIELADKEVLIYQINNKKQPYPAKEISFGQKTYAVKESLPKDNLLKKIIKEYSETGNYNYPKIENCYMVFFSSKNEALAACAELATNKVEEMIEKGTTPFTYLMNYSGSKKQREQFETNAKKYIVKHAKQLSISTTDYSGKQKYPSSISELPYYLVNFLDDARERIYIQFGGFLFIGLICSIVFLLAVALIIYYKQLSEGEQDKYRFEIMQEVGLGKDEVKKIINNQLWIFFLGPLFFAGLNVTFAFPMMHNMLSSLFDQSMKIEIIVKIFVGTLSVFTLFYLIIYLKTSKIYYRIVKRK